jgi:hypothetical protein
MAVGRTDRLKGAPFYKTYSPVVLPAQNVLVLPLAIDPVSREEHLRGGRERIFLPLQNAFDAYIAGTACCVPSQSGIPEEGQPWIYVGSSEGEYAPPQADDQRMEHEKYPPMVIHLEKPDARWRERAVDHIENENAGAIIVVRLGFAQYPKADQGFFGKKVVLGTNNELPIRFLSAETKPVEVLQITGMLVDSSGEVIRAGAEGIIARDAPFWVQVFEAGRDIDNAAIRAVLVDERRDDLPGAPLSWQIAIDNLLWQLLRPGK